MMTSVARSANHILEERTDIGHNLHTNDSNDSVQCQTNERNTDTDIRV